MLLNGNKVRDELKGALIEKVRALSRPPTVAIVQVGDNERSLVYISKKQEFAEEIGCKTTLVHFKEESVTEDIIAGIDTLNADEEVDGVIVQLPLPDHIDRSLVVERVAYEKDADALTSGRIKDLWEEREDVLIPATASGILSLLDAYAIPIEGKHITIVGRSSLVGKPMALAALKRGATVTVCHKQTQDLPRYAKVADIIVSATGVPSLIKGEHVSAGQTVVDVGITVSLSRGEKMIFGDVDFKSVEPIVEYVTPVPGGVGPMTVYALFENIVELCLKKKGV